MKQLVRAYRLVRWIDGEIQVYDKESPEVALQAQRHLLKSPVVMEEYPELQKHETPNTVRDLIEYCVSKHYLEKEKIGGIWNLRVSDSEGRDFLDTPPFGFLEELFKKRPYTGGLVSGLTLAALLALAKWIF